MLLASVFWFIQDFQKAFLILFCLDDRMMEAFELFWFEHKEHRWVCVWWTSLEKNGLTK